ncbi:MAG: hypothetical protein ACR2NQ_02800 [Thermodesulfobacteriota bacterium]
MNKFSLYKKEAEKPHFVLTACGRAWIVPFLQPFEETKKRLAIEIPSAAASGFADNPLESGDIVVNTNKKGKFDFTASGKIMNGRFVFVLQSWGRRTKKPLWLMVKSSSKKGGTE